MDEEVNVNFATVVLLAFAVKASATLVTIGTAQFSGGSDEYNLICDDDYNGNSVVWLDYSNPNGVWASQNAWVAGLSSFLTYKLNGYQVDWGTSDWRLPSAYLVDGSERGDPFYNELGLTAAIPVDKVN